MKLTDFDALTFDCYGTLIDWESGIHSALQPLLARHGLEVDRDSALTLFGEHESAQEVATPTALYPDLLADVLRRVAAAWGVDATDEEATAFGGSVGDWPAFEDSPAALTYLKQHYKLVILSNVDRESFQHSNARLGVEFDGIFTAQDIGSYKPNPANFDYLLARMAEIGVDKPRILHTAQSLYHDHVPARRFGLAWAWIDRRAGAAGWGATKAVSEEAPYDFRFESLAEFADQHRADLAG